MTECGWQWTRVTTAEVESNDRRLTMEELFTVAALFSVPAIELMMPDEKLLMDLPYTALDAEEVRELLVGRGSTVGTGGPGWLIARTALGSPRQKSRDPPPICGAQEPLSRQLQPGSKRRRSERTDGDDRGPQSGS
jgi:hypothetical protein